MKQKIQLVVRILLGALFLFGGIAFFFTTPPPQTGDMGTFFNGLVASHYFLYLLKFTEIFCGLCFVSGYFVPLALVILAPISLNIFMVHLMLEPKGLPLALGIGIAMIYLSFFSPSYSPKIRSLFAMK